MAQHIQNKWYRLKRYSCAPVSSYYRYIEFKLFDPHEWDQYGTRKSFKLHLECRSTASGSAIGTTLDRNALISLNKARAQITESRQFVFVRRKRYKLASPLSDSYSIASAQLFRTRSIPTGCTAASQLR